MSTALPTRPSQPIPATPCTPSVRMGRRDYLSVLLRLTMMELYKLRHRLLLKVLFVVAVGFVALIMLVFALTVGIDRNKPAADFAPPPCSQVSRVQASHCLEHQPTQAELEHDKQTAIEDASRTVRLPGSMATVIGFTITAGILTPLIIILTGAMVGGDYGFGMVRLLFTRGPTRLQFLLAKLSTVLVCIVIGILTITLVGIALGYLFRPISGVTPTFDFFTAAWLGHALLYLLAAMLSWFMYAVIALFLSLLGRSTAAGIAGSLIWVSVEAILSGLLSTFGDQFGGFFKALPDYFVGNNATALLNNQNHFVTGYSASSLSDAHTLLVLAGYLVVFIGLSCWLTVRRDVTQ